MTRWNVKGADNHQFLPGESPPGCPDKGLWHLKRAPKRTFEECQRRARRGAPVPNHDASWYWIKLRKVK